jgi:ABC-type glycerol-3-phosphate transport system substrate-binding protein
LLPQQLIKVDGKVMAIAFMANAQHLFYRKDILEEHGIAVPGTYAELIEASKMLKDKGVMEYPLAANFKPGWNLAAEFVNAYLGTGGDFFKAGSAELDIDNANGMKTLETLKAMTNYMSPDYVTYDTNGVKPIWEANELAFVTSWGSRASAYIGDDSPAPEIAKATALAAMPALMDGGVPSAALWWDGFTIAKNISDEDAEASFRAMMKGISPQVIAENQELAVWLVDGYAPTPAADGVVANLQGKARPYPMVPYMGLLHTALGDNVIEYLQGSESAEQALDDITAAYNTAAKEAGFLN